MSSRITCLWWKPPRVEYPCPLARRQLPQAPRVSQCRALRMPQLQPRPLPHRSSSQEAQEDPIKLEATLTVLAKDKRHSRTRDHLRQLTPTDLKYQHQWAGQQRLKPTSSTLHVTARVLAVVARPEIWISNLQIPSSAVTLFRSPSLKDQKLTISPTWLLTMMIGMRTR